MTKLQKKLEAIKADYNRTDLEKDIAQELLDRGSDEEIKSYVSDVMNHGCVSGTVSSLIYYADTKAFYVKHMDDIQELYEETTESLGEPLRIGTPMSNWFAWFGYEETTRKIADELNITY